jgi:mannosyltransferase
VSAGQGSKTSASPDPQAGARPADGGGQAAAGWTAIAAACVPAGAAAATMAVLGLWGLARDSAMGNDEVATRWAALLSLRHLVHLTRNVDAVHGLYYLLMHGWMAVGTSPAVIRIPSVLGMTAAAALTVIIARRLTGSGWAGLFAGLIMALTPIVSYYAQTARSYALVFACVLGSTLALLHAMEAETASGTDQRIARRWLSYGALVALGGYLNELSLLVLAAHAITVVLARYGRRAVAHWAAAAAGAAVLVAPLVYVSSREDKVISWISRPGLADLRVLFHDYFGATTGVAVLLVMAAVAAVLPGGRWRRRPAGPAQETSLTPAAPWWRCGGISLPSVAMPLLLAPSSVLFIESLVARPLYVDRYVLYGAAGAAMLAGAGVYRIGRWLGDAANRRALIWVPGVVLCLCALLLQIGPQQRVRTPQSRLFNFGGPSQFVAANAHRGDGVLFFTAFYRKARLGYPGDFRKVTDFALAVPPAQNGNFQGRDKPFALAGPLMLGYRRIWVVGRPPSAMLSAGSMRQESMLLASRFTLISERHFRRIVVTLWLRR